MVGLALIVSAAELTVGMMAGLLVVASCLGSEIVVRCGLPVSDDSDFSI